MQQKGGFAQLPFAKTALPDRKRKNILNIETIRHMRRMGVGLSHINFCSRVRQ